MADTCSGQPMPREQVPGIALATGRHVEMSNHPVGRDPPAADDIGAQRRDGFDLRIRERQVAIVVTRIDDLDSDGGRAGSRLVLQRRSF